jgi:hypothetical protein
MPGMRSVTASRHRPPPTTAKSNWSGFTNIGNHLREVNLRRR